MNELFYIAFNGKQNGPFSYDDLKSIGIQRDALIWTEGLDSWTKAESISLLKDILRAIPQTENLNNGSLNIPPIPNASQAKYFGYDLASKMDRFKAAILQLLVLIIPVLIIHAIVTGGLNGDNAFGDFVLNIILSALLGAILYPIWCGNIGHKLLGLKVISSVDGSDMKKPGEGALRELTKTALGIVIIPSIWLLWDNDNQNLYDKIVKSYVVKKSKPANSQS